MARGGARLMKSNGPQMCHPGSSQQQLPPEPRWARLNLNVPNAKEFALLRNKFRSIVLPFVMALMILGGAADAHAAPEIEIIKGEFSRKHSDGNDKGAGTLSVIFNKGKVGQKRLELNPGDRIASGIRLRRSVKVLTSDDQSDVIVHTRDVDVDERNPYRIQASPSRISWYRADGSVACEVQTPMVPVVISPKGNALLAIEDGFDDVEFEKYHDVPGLESTETLKNDKSLTENRLYLLDSSCAVVFQTASRSGWDTLLISPSGKWIAYRDYSTPDTLAVVEISGKRQLDVNISGGRDWSISDMGALSGYRYLGHGEKVKETVRSLEGRDIQINTKRFQKLSWKPGYPSVKALDEVIEK